MLGCADLCPSSAKLRSSCAPKTYPERTKSDDFLFFGRKSPNPLKVVCTNLGEHVRFCTCAKDTPVKCRLEPEISASFHLSCAVGPLKMLCSEIMMMQDAHTKKQFHCGSFQMHFSTHQGSFRVPRNKTGCWYIGMLCMAWVHLYRLAGLQLFHL